MQSFWRDNNNWQHIGGERRIPPPKLDPLPTVRVRVRDCGRCGASFLVDGEPAEVGAIVSVSSAEADYLEAAGKAQRV